MTLKRRTIFLLSIFLPLALLATINSLFSFWSITALDKAYRTSSQHQKDDLITLAEASGLGYGLLQTHQSLSGTLDAARAGGMDGNSLYRHRTEFEEGIALTAGRLEQLRRSHHVGDLASELDEMARLLEAYRNSMLKTVELASASSSDAHTQQQEAERLSRAFIDHAQHLSAALAKGTAADLPPIDAVIGHHLDRAIYTGALSLLIICALWFLASRALTRRAEAIADSLSALATGDTDAPVLREMERLGRETGSAMQEIASSVLAFRTAIETRRSVEERLAGEREQLKALMDGIPDPVWLKDPNGVYLSCNPRFEALYGKSQAEILGRSDYDFVSREQAEFFRVHDRRAMELDAPTVNEEWLTFASDGHRELVETIKTPIRDAQGAVIGVLGVARNITTLRTAAEALARREDIYRALVTQASLGIVLIDAETLRFAEFNDAACQSIGYTREEFSLLTLRDIQSPKRIAEFDGRLREIMACGEAAFESLRLCKDGSEHDVWVTVKRLRLNDHDYLSSIWADITEQKEIQRVLLRYQGQLQTMVAERTVGLAAARDAAEAASRAKDAFLANMSHEVNTPLNAIIGVAYLLRRECASTPTHHLLERLDAAAQRLKSLFSDIVDLAQIEARRAHLEIGDFDLPAALERICAPARNRALAKGLTLRTDLGALPQVVRGDERRLGQILGNLLDNAVKFTREGEIDLRSYPIRDDGATQWIRFEVRDTGPGIDPPQQRELFRAFTQTDTSNARLHGGAGLGLALVRGLARLMGGEVGVTSEPGKGSCFWLEAPFVAGGPQAALTPIERPALHDALAQLEGLDLPAALGNVNGDEILLGELLRDFGRDHRDDATAMHDALDAGDTASAQRIAHTLKGLAATFGMTHLRELARTLEQTLRSATPGTEAIVSADGIAMLGTELERACRGLRALPEPAPPLAAAAPAAEINWSALRDDIDRLRAYLDNDDIEAAHLFERLRQPLETFAAEATERLAAEIDDYAFDRARAALDKVIAALPA